MRNCCETSDLEHVEDKRFRKILWVVLALNICMFLVEIVSSYMAGSVSLLADALDFLGDAFNYGISLFVLARSAIHKAKASLIKGMTMALFGIYVLASSIYRVMQGGIPEAELMSIIGALALIVNITCAVLLYRHRAGDINRESVWICSRNDAIANIAVLLAALGVYLTGTFWPDVVVAALIAGLCLKSAIYVICKARIAL
jgi:cation diffusion facilitator family transporter